MSFGRWYSLKYYILLFVTAAAVLSLSPAYLFEPITILFRTFTMAFFPVVFILWQKASAWFPLLLSHPLAPSSAVLFQGGLLFLGFFFVIWALEGLERRFWCRYLCPMGALLGVFSRLAFNQKKVSSACTDCGLCRKHCRTGAIAPGNRDFLPSECIYCMECKALCPSKAISFSLTRSLPWLGPLVDWARGKDRKTSPLPEGFPVPDLSRRTAILSMAGGCLWALTGQVDYGSRMKYSRLIRPPGALPEEQFISQCIRCGQCMKICVTNGLQPTFMEAGLSGMWTPCLVPLRGYCEENCNLCTRICPTGAITPVDVKDKKKIAIGKARINTGKCIAWYQGAECLVCDEHCSYKAVFWEERGGVRRPFVDAQKCVGCGICENKCPTGPDPAIVVFALNEGMKDIVPKG